MSSPWHRLPQLKTVLTLGRKTSAIISALPGIAALYFDGMRWRTAIILGITAVLFAITAGLQFDKHLRHAGIREAASYVARRAFVLTAQVPYQTTQQSLAGRDFDYISTPGSAATDSIILKHVNPNDLYRYNFARAMTERLYPDQKSRVNSGRWNVTPNVFTEGFLALGFAFYWYFSVLTAILIWSFNISIKITIRNGALPAAAVLMGYYVFVFNAWVNSGGLTNLIHPLSILSYGCAFIVLFVIDRHPIGRL
jgi:hypothetical protein